jgi:hypothetical protein
VLLVAVGTLALVELSAGSGRSVASSYCGGASPRPSGGVAATLVVTPLATAALRRALLDCYRGPGKRRIKGPRAGTVHLARFGGYVWAIATFSLPATGTTDQPERFIRRVGRRQWRDLGDTGGPLSDRLPCPVLTAWHIACS